MQKPYWVTRAVRIFRVVWVIRVTWELNQSRVIRVIRGNRLISSCGVGVFGIISMKVIRIIALSMESKEVILLATHLLKGCLGLLG